MQGAKHPSSNFKDVGKAAIEAALDLIPFGGGFLKNLASQHQQRRHRAFLDSLSAGKVQLADVSANDDMVHAILCTLDAASKSETEDKAKRFGRLCSAYLSGQVPSLSELEETTSILDDLSEREWMTLLILNRHFGCEENGAYQRLKGNWQPAEDEIVSAGVPVKDVPSFLQRLERTGLVRVLGVKVKKHPAHAALVQGRWLDIARYVSGEEKSTDS